MPNVPEAVDNLRPPSIKILFLQASSIYERYGGIESYLQDLFSLLSEVLGRKNVSAISAHRKTLDIPAGVDSRVELIRLQQSGYLAKIQNRFSLNVFLAARKRALAFKPDYLLCGHVSLGPMVFLLSKLLKIPYVSCVYGLESWGNLWPQDEFCLRRAHKIISISHWTKAVLEKRGYPESQIEIIHPRMSPEIERQIGANSSSDHRTFTLLTVARLDANERYKGQDHVLEALAKIKATENPFKFLYLICGEGDDRPRLESLVEKLNLKAEVKFLSAVSSREELASIYPLGDVFIMPSQFGFREGKWRGEGFGIVYVEAAVFGLPSIAYDCGGVTDIIRHRENGLLVPQGDIDGLSSAILECAKKPQFRRQMGVKARERALEYFSGDAIRIEVNKALQALEEGKKQWVNAYS